MKPKKKPKLATVRKNYSPTAFIKAKHAVSLDMSKKQYVRKFGISLMTLLVRLS